MSTSNSAFLFYNQVKGVLIISSSAYFIPIIGPAVSAGIGIVEVAYGEQFYNYLEERFDE